MAKIFFRALRFPCQRRLQVRFDTAGEAVGLCEKAYFI